MEAERRPIGYWLKHVDGLLEAALDRTLAEDGMTRRQWQVLNVVHGGGADDAAIARQLAPFWVEGAGSQAQVIGELRRRGWIRRGADQRHVMTEQGEVARTAVAGRVGSMRATATEGISTEDYLRVVDTLRTMAANLAVTGGAAAG